MAEKKSTLCSRCWGLIPYQEGDEQVRCPHCDSLETVVLTKTYTGEAPVVVDMIHPEDSLDLSAPQLHRDEYDFYKDETNLLVASPTTQERHVQLEVNKLYALDRFETRRALGLSGILREDLKISLGVCEEGLMVADRGQEGGLRVGGERVQRTLIGGGGQFHVGPYLFKYKAAELTSICDNCGDVIPKAISQVEFGYVDHRKICKRCLKNDPLLGTMQERALLLLDRGRQGALRFYKVRLEEREAFLFFLEAGAVPPRMAKQFCYNPVLCSTGARLFSAEQIVADGRRFYARFPARRGTSLEHRLRRAWRFSIQEALRMADRILLALAGLHQEGRVYPDLSLLYLFLDNEGEIRFFDPAWAELLSKINRTLFEEERRFLFTPHCLPPETFKSQPMTQAGNLYAVGAILYQLLTGTPLLGEEGDMEKFANRLLYTEPVALEQRLPGVPERIALLVRKALSRNPGARFANVSEFRQEIRGCLDQFYGVF